MNIVLTCQECSNPWGIVLERDEIPTPESLATAVLDLQQTWREAAECDVDVDELGEVDFDLSKLPSVSATEVVYITEALADFATDRFGAICAEGPCWQEVQYVDFPAWLIKGRRRRWAYRWDCCDIGWAMNYVIPPDVPAVADDSTTAGGRRTLSTSTTLVAS
jgi:hypothetical protein